jgi:D-amino-acid dehydrogenase
MTSVGSGKKLVIIGSGIIGLCSAYHLLEQDWEITVVSSDPADDTTACGSAGAIANAQIFPVSEPGLFLKVPRWLLDPLGPLSIRPGHMPKLMGWLVKFLAAGTKPRVETSIRALASLTVLARDHHFELIKEINAQDLLRQKGCLNLYHSERSRDKDAYQWAMRRQFGIEFSAVNRQQILEHEPALGPGAHCGYFLPDWCHYIDPQKLLATLAD